MELKLYNKATKLAKTAGDVEFNRSWSTTLKDDVKGTLSQMKLATLNDTLTVSGDTKINNKFNVTAASGNLDMSGNLTVHGTIN